MKKEQFELGCTVLVDVLGMLVDAFVEGMRWMFLFEYDDSGRIAPTSRFVPCLIVGIEPAAGRLNPDLCITDYLLVLRLAFGDCTRAWVAAELMAGSDRFFSSSWIRSLEDPP